VGLIAASIAAFASMYASAGHKVPAIVVVRSLAQGQLITGADVGPADVAVSAGVEYIPLAQSGRLVGKRAAGAISKGSLLTMADLSAVPAIKDGEAVVGIALKAGAYPAGGLSPGDEVMVVQTASPGAALAAPQSTTTPSGSGPFDSVAVSASAAASTAISGVAQSGTGVLVARAPVTSVAVPATGSTGGYSIVVSVEVASADAPAVATAAAAGQVGIVLLGTSPGPSSSTTHTTSTTGGPS